eukprot:8230117-Pyramimonas_sp.AAC.1
MTKALKHKPTAVERANGGGDVARVKSVLKKHVLTPNSVSYKENMGQSSVDRSKLLAHAKLIADLFN